MLVLDTSILSTFTHLGIIDFIERLRIEVCTTPRVVAEYYERWGIAQVPKWMKIVSPKVEMKRLSRRISRVDMSIIDLASEMRSMIGTDDAMIRRIAKRKKIGTIGTLSILKSLYKKGIYNEKEEYLKLVKKLQKDFYMSEEVREWAEEV